MVAMVATSASLDTVDPSTAQPWTMLPAWPSFLPIVRELVAFGLAHDRLEQQAAPGETIGGTLPSTWADSSVRIERPDNRIDVVPVVRRDSSAEWSYRSTHLPGPYQVRPLASDATLSVSSVNVPAGESNLERVATDALPAALAVRTAATDDESARTDLVAEAAVHRWLLYVVLMLLLAESVMAWAFAGRSV
jgi:hypothetical protein